MSRWPSGYRPITSKDPSKKAWVAALKAKSECSKVTDLIYSVKAGQVAGAWLQIVRGSGRRAYKFKRKGVYFLYVWEHPSIPLPLFGKPIQLPLNSEVKA